MELLDDLDESAGQAAAESVEVAEPAEVAEVAGPSGGEAAGAQGARADVQRTVPLEVLLEERRRFQQKLSEQEEQSRQLAERLARLEGPVKPEQPPPEPDFLEDPKGYIDSAVSRIERATQEAREKTQALQAHTEQQEQFVRFVATLRSDEAAFIAKHADYQQALDHARATRYAELKALAPPGTSDEQIRQYQGQEELQLAAYAMSNGMSPAEVAYRIAQQRGYQSQAAPPGGGGNEATARSALAGGGGPGRAAAAMTLGAGGVVPGLEAAGVADGLEQFDAALNEAFGSR
jgi:hypothetical protein